MAERVVGRSQAIMDAAERLARAGVETPEKDARVLLLWTESIVFSDLTSSPERAITKPDAYEAAIIRRANREPVSKILGRRSFWKHDFAVTPDVLDPRAETETLVEIALSIFRTGDQLRVLDLGTGSGCILLSLLSEFPSATGVGVDQSNAALAVAACNAKALGIVSRAEFLASDWFEALDESFNLVVCNPPYISFADKKLLSPEVTEWDPEEALFAGMDGLQAYREIADGLATVLKPNGTALLEFGIGQRDSVASLFKDAGFTRITSRSDLGGCERVLIVQH